MATTYYWTIDSMVEKPQEGTLLDVVICVNWRRHASTVVDTKTIEVNSYGAYNCTTPSPTDFTAYPDLTFEQVCGWLDTGLDVPAIDLLLDKELEYALNPPTIQLPLPWSTN
jgi:hypothetical protein